MSRSPKFAWLVACLLIAAPAAAQRFGHRTARPGPQRHLLAIQLDYQDRAFGADRQPAYFTGLLFGSALGTLEGWYAAASNGRFRIDKRGVLGPYRMPDDPNTTDNESLIDCWPGNPALACPTSLRGDVYQLNSAVRQAIAANHDFKQYDTNSDKRITSDELVVMAITADLGLGGGLRCFAVKEGVCIENCHTAGTGADQVQVCLSTGLNLSSRANIATFLHEFGHMLGMTDTYGAWLPWGSNHNAGASLMAATIDGNDGWYVGLDPIHRLSTGWVDAPTVVSTAGPSACVRLAPLGAPVVVYDPARGQDEYLLLEYRRRAGVDKDAGGDGVVVWHVRLENGAWALSDQVIARKALPAGTVATADIASRGGWQADDNFLIQNGFWERIEWGADGHLNSQANATDDLFRARNLHALGPRQTPDDRTWQAGARGVTTFWRREHGTVALNWPGLSRTPVGAQIIVGATEADGVYVRIVKKDRTLPEDTPAACIEATKPLPQAFPPPARLTISPRCLTRNIAWVDDGRRRKAVSVPIIKASAELDMREPLAANTSVVLSVVNGLAKPSQEEMVAGAVRLPVKVETSAQHLQGMLTVRAEIQRPAAQGVPPWTEVVEASAIILPARGSMTCGDLARLGKDVEIRPPYRRPGPIPIGDGNHDIPVFLLEPIVPGMILPTRPRPGRPTRVDLEVLELEVAPERR